jgi:hypothetical protein
MTRLRIITIISAALIVTGVLSNELGSSHSQPTSTTIIITAK